MMSYTPNKLFAFVPLALLAVTSCTTGTSNSADALCNIVTEAMATDLSFDQKTEVMTKKFNSGVIDPEIKKILILSRSAKPVDRYDIIKQSIEKKTHKPWNCPSLKSYYQLAQEKEDKAFKK
jgi:hypothetical protein